MAAIKNRRNCGIDEWNKKIVFSRTLKTAEWNNTTIICISPSDEIRKLKEQNGGDLYVFGSADLPETFVHDYLFDEYRICIVPVILGLGRPLFKQCIATKNLNLVSTQQLQSGGVILKYSK